MLLLWGVSSLNYIIAENVYEPIFISKIIYTPTPTPLSLSLSHAGVKGVVKPWQWLNGDIIFLV